MRRREMIQKLASHIKLHENLFIYAIQKYLKLGFL